MTRVTNRFASRRVQAMHESVFGIMDRAKGLVRAARQIGRFAESGPQ